MSVADSSGVCSLSVQVGASTPIADSSLSAQNNSSWQECQQPVSWTAAVDTQDFVSGAGQVPITVQATDAVGSPTQSSTSETLNVDNDPVSVSLSTPNDPNPTVWVNHAVTVDATPSTGPSGLGGMSCNVNGAAAQTYPAGGLYGQWRRGQDGDVHRLEQRGRPARESQLRHELGDGSHRRDAAVAELRSPEPG